MPKEINLPQDTHNGRRHSDDEKLPGPNPVFITETRNFIHNFSNNKFFAENVLFGMGFRTPLSKSDTYKQVLINKLETGDFIYEGTPGEKDIAIERVINEIMQNPHTTLKFVADVENVYYSGDKLIVGNNSYITISSEKLAERNKRKEEEKKSRSLTGKIKRALGIE